VPCARWIRAHALGAWNPSASGFRRKMSSCTRPVGDARGKKPGARRRSIGNVTDSADDQRAEQFLVAVGFRTVGLVPLDPTRHFKDLILLEAVGPKRKLGLFGFFGAGCRKFLGWGLLSSTRAATGRQGSPVLAVREKDGLASAKAGSAPVRPTREFADARPARQQGAEGGDFHGKWARARTPRNSGWSIRLREGPMLPSRLRTSPRGELPSETQEAHTRAFGGRKAKRRGTRPVTGSPPGRGPVGWCARKNVVPGQRPHPSRPAGRLALDRTRAGRPS